MSAIPMIQSPPTPTSRLVSKSGLELPLREAHLSANAEAGHASVVLRQRFANPSSEPLEVSYQLPLPADAAVAGFTFTLHDRRIVGRVESRQQARATYDQALFEGRSAALIEQQRVGLFTQLIGNVPPHSEIEIELHLDQPLAWVDGGWEWRFPTVVAPRYVDGGVSDAAELAVEVADGPLPARLGLALRIADALTGPVVSPSHALATTGPEVSLDRGRARLDRDVVIRWPVAMPEPGVRARCGLAGGSRFAMLTLTPPLQPDGLVGRDLVVLLDTSGSMGGEPLAQARAVVHSLLGELHPTDTLELLSFGSHVERWQAEPVLASPVELASAGRWLDALRASGGTRMDQGIEAALAVERPDAQRQVLLVTDGHIGFEQRIVAMVRERCVGSRLHVLGIGHGVNRSLTTPVSRAGRGTEAIVAPGEPVTEIAKRLAARLVGPVLVDLRLVGDGESGALRLPDLYAGSPACIPVRLGEGPLRLEGRSSAGGWCQELQLEPGQPDPALGRLWARERAADLEVAAAMGEDVDVDLELLGTTWQIVTRLTSFVAVSEQSTVDPTSPTRSVRIAQELPAGMSVEGLGLRRGGGHPFVYGAQLPSPAPAPGGGGAAPRSLRRKREAAPRPSPAREQADGEAPMDRMESPSMEDAELHEEPAGMSAFGRMRDWLLREPSPASEPDPLQSLVVRWSVAGGVLRIEFRARASGWKGAGPLTLVLADGTEVQAESLAAQTTRGGAHAPGTHLRLVIRLADHALPPNAEVVAVRVQHLTLARP